MTADMKVAAAGGTRCDICHQWFTDLRAHGITAHLGSEATIADIRPEDTILIDGRVVTVTSKFQIGEWTYVFDSNNTEHRYHHTQLDTPVRIISTADPDADEKAYRDEAGWDE